MKTTKLIKVGYEFSKLIDQWKDMSLVVVKVLINVAIGIKCLLKKLTRKTLPRDLVGILLPPVDADDDELEEGLDILISAVVSGS